MAGWSPPARLLAGALTLAACGLDPAPSQDGTGGTTDGSGGTDTSGSSTAGSADETGEPGPEPARGLTIARIDANSGTGIRIAADGVPIPDGERAAPLPKNRNTAVRVYVDIDEAVWVQRDIEAHLTIRRPDGAETTYVEVETIAADSSETSLQSNFLFGALAEWVVPGAEYRVELVETGPGWEAIPEPTTPPAVPAEGFAALGAHESTQRMRVMVVPIEYTGPDGTDCSASIDTSDANLQRYTDQLFQHNPVEDIELMVHEPYVVDDIDLSKTGPVYLLLARMSTLRMEDDPDPDVYYFGLFDNCGQCITSDGSGGVDGCLLGVAAGIAEDTVGAAGLRVAVGIDHVGNTDFGPDTFVHELGHCQGRRHIECPGQTAAGPDPSYPYDNGSIGVWGFGVLDFGVRNPSNHKDYMSYCNPTWVSDWQWTATFERIETLSSWGYGVGDAPPRDDEARMLMGMLDPAGGSAFWWTARGEAPVASALGLPAWALTYELADGTQLPVAATVNAWSEGPWVTVRAPLSPALDRELSGVALAAPTRTLHARSDEIRRRLPRD